MVITNIKISPGSHRPMYRQFADELKALIVNGKLVPGERLPTSKEFQEGLKLSAITVESGITRLVNQEYLIRRPRLGTFVNPAKKIEKAKNFISTRQGMKGQNIRVIFCDIPCEDIYWYHILSSIESKLYEYGVNLIFSRIMAKNFYKSFNMNSLLSDTQGVILCGYLIPEIIDFFQKHKIPLSAIGSLRENIKHYKAISSVVHDDVHRAYISTSHLLELGHRSIAMVIRSADNCLEKDFVKGYKLAMKEYGLGDDNMHIETVAEHTLKCGQSAGAKLMINSSRPTAVFACDDRVAAGIIKAVQKLGFEVPRDLSIVGCGNLEIAEAVTPGLTTTASFPEKSAFLAVEKLKNQFTDNSNKPSVEVIRIEEIILRESTLFYRKEQ